MDFAIGIGRYVLPRHRPRRLKAAQKRAWGLSGKEPSARRSVTTATATLGPEQLPFAAIERSAAATALYAEFMFINTLIGKHAGPEHVQVPRG
jgi:hypothetical protein